MRRLVHAVYRRLLVAPARRALRRMQAEGLPAALVAPLRYLMQPSFPASDRRVVDSIEEMRSLLAQRSDALPIVYDSPAPVQQPGNSSPPSVPRPAVSWAQLAAIASVVPYWGRFLYLCARHLQARTILELGSCAGISACYLCAGSPEAELITVEGSSQLAAIAQGNLQTVSNHARVVNALFDEALDEWLPRLSGRLDLVHIDGQHERLSTLHYFARLRPHLRPGALLIFDDVHWTADMRLAWDDLCKQRGLSHAINVGRYGLCVWQGGDVAPRVHDFSRYARHWRSGKATAHDIHRAEAIYRGAKCGG